MDEGLAELMVATFLASFSMPFITCAGIASGQWESVPPFAANMWDTYKRVFIIPMVQHYYSDPGEGDEVSSDL